MALAVVKAIMDDSKITLGSTVQSNLELLDNRIKMYSCCMQQQEDKESAG